MDGQKKEIGKANERKGKVKKTKDDEVNRQREKGRVPLPHTGQKDPRWRHVSGVTRVGVTRCGN